MKRIGKFVQMNRKRLLIFLIFLCIAFGVFGVVTAVEHQNLEKEKAQEEKEKKQEEQQKKQKEQEQQEQVTTEEVVEQNQESVSNEVSTSNAKEESTEENVISYFSKQENLSMGNESDSSLREQLKNGVSTIYQFLFHGGTIYGKTFSELSSSAKLRVLKIALSIDQKIDSYFPNYKENIKLGAKNLKSKIVVTYLEITNQICSNHEDICSQAREDFVTMKKSFKITFSLIKDLAVSGSTALKEWYLSK